MKVHHAGKMGDLIYALPAIRALARHEGPITLITSGHCYQMVPLLMELSYLEDVVIDGTRSYAMDGKICDNWNFFKEGEGAEGINLSLQPEYHTEKHATSTSWTHCYAKKAGVQLCPADYVVFPNLINHRRWLDHITASFDGVPETRINNVIIAPESETLRTGNEDFWDQLIRICLNRGYSVIVIGKTQDRLIPKVYKDLRGMTSVPTMARIIAESTAFIGSHSLPWHLARHSEVPAVCIARKMRGLERCIPIDTPCNWIEPHEYMKALEMLKL